MGRHPLRGWHSSRGLIAVQHSEVCPATRHQSARGIQLTSRVARLSSVLVVKLHLKSVSMPQSALTGGFHPGLMPSVSGLRAAMGRRLLRAMIAGSDTFFGP